MKILCLSRLAIPYMDGTTICISALLRALMDAGHEVRLITARNLPSTADSPHLPAPGWESVGCPTRHLDVKWHSQPGRLSRWISGFCSLMGPLWIPSYEDTEWIHAAGPALLDEINTFRPDVVLSTDPRSSHLAALRARSRRKFTWVVSLDDPWERSTMFEKPRPYSLGHLYHRRVITLIAHKADAFLFPSKRLAEFERTFSLGSWPSVVEVIPHLGSVAKKATPRTPGRFRLLHVGDLRPRGRADCLLPEALQKAASQEPGLKKELEVVFVGDVPDRFKSRAAACIGPAFQWIPPCPYPAALEYIASSDVNVVIERQSPKDILMLSKVADYALVNAPILALGPRVGNMPDLAAQGQCLHAPSDDADAIAEQILVLYRAWKAGEMAGYRHDALAEMCRPINGGQKFEALVRKISEASGAGPVRAENETKELNKRVIQG